MWLSLARALRSGRRGRRFKSSHPDQSRGCPRSGFGPALVLSLGLFEAPKSGCFAYILHAFSHILLLFRFALALELPPARLLRGLLALFAQLF